MINRYLKIVAVLLLMTYTAFANAEIGIYDLRYTLNTDLNTKEGLDVAWDDVHAVSTLQGEVNRDAPRLYWNLFLQVMKNMKHGKKEYPVIR